MWHFSQQKEKSKGEFSTKATQELPSYQGSWPGFLVSERWWMQDYNFSSQPPRGACLAWAENYWRQLRRTAWNPPAGQEEGETANKGVASSSCVDHPVLHGSSSHPNTSSLFTKHQSTFSTLSSVGGWDWDCAGSYQGDDDAVAPLGPQSHGSCLDVRLARHHLRLRLVDAEYVCGRQKCLRNIRSRRGRVQHSSHSRSPRFKQSVIFLLKMSSLLNLAVVKACRVASTPTSRTPTTTRDLSLWRLILVEKYFYRTRVRSLGMLVTNSLTHWLTP